MPPTRRSRPPPPGHHQLVRPKTPNLKPHEQVDDANTISPTLSLKKGYLTYTWTHLLGDGAKLETTLDPFNVRYFYIDIHTNK